MQAFIKELKALHIDSMDWDRETKSLIDTVVSPTVIERDGLVIVSAEDGKGFADYWGCDEIQREGMYIHPELEALADKHGMYWEWEDAGAISIAS